jgi:hypothetical protein
LYRSPRLLQPLAGSPLRRKNPLALW